MNVFSIKYLLATCLLALAADTMAQTATPVVSFYVEKKDETGVITTEYVEIKDGDKGEGNAPLEVTCRANLEYDFTEYDKVVSEWKIYRADDGEDKPTVDRFEEDMTYTITKSGGYVLKFYATFINTANNDTIEFVTENGISLVVSESKLIVPDGLSPNDDGINDKLLIEAQSIVKLEGYIINRWGQKLHTFTIENLSDGWDGKVNGKPVRDGAYLIYLDAIGSDGLHYKIRKAINVLKGYREDSDSSTSY